MGAFVFRMPEPWKTAFDGGFVLGHRGREKWLSVGCSSSAVEGVRASCAAVVADEKWGEKRAR